MSTSKKANGQERIPPAAKGLIESDLTDGACAESIIKHIDNITIAGKFNAAVDNRAACTEGNDIARDGVANLVNLSVIVFDKQAVIDEAE